ncbi:metallophosphoesterase [Pseudoalteromonas ruthenica]|uniref:metallophosphoesterase n=1 Tax=Pseudoalteromonas ruthenica TaxID=151081 RepID=UPI00110B7BE6|nr:metallophosphoesterase [Pseudoalteromonas ruthenica]TMO45722.1 3',5'-cyclic-nucleotide phosphodiesterase [Pseudoalteromonas ruthenica]TMO50748.1 3',5'-cyclic-nucleotide phosphodiesterase [Pseudoalteromonas ruthenica]
MAWFDPPYFCPASTELSFAHFTDAHLFAQPQEQYFGVRTAQHLQQTLAAMAAEAFDFVVFGGDLTQDHSPESYQLFAELVANSALQCPVFWVPGNHDELSQLNAMTEGQIRPEKRIEHACGQVLLINSKGDTPAGWVAEHHLAELGDAINTAAPQQVFITHHHPLPIHGYLDKHILENGDALLQCIETRSRSATVLHGHTHHDYHHDYQGVEVFGTPATSVQFVKNAPSWQQENLGPGYRRVRLVANKAPITEVKWLAN